MELSVVAVTGNRRFSKALVRHAKIVQAACDAVRGQQLEGGAFDVLQLVFVDDDPKKLRVGRASRLKQVEVVIPIAEDGFGEPAAFARALSESVRVALGASGLSLDEARRLAAAVDGALQVAG